METVLKRMFGGMILALLILGGRAHAEEEPAREPQWKLQLQERLRQNVCYRFEGIPFRDAKEYLQTQGRVVINVERLARDSVPGLDQVLIHLASPPDGMSLESALNGLTRQVNLAWILRDESIVITTGEGVREPEIAVQYDVRDLVFALKDYPGPEISIGKGGEGVRFAEKERREEAVNEEDLVALIRKMLEEPAQKGKP